VHWRFFYTFTIILTLLSSGLILSACTRQIPSPTGTAERDKVYSAVIEQRFSELPQLLIYEYTTLGQTANRFGGVNKGDLKRLMGVALDPDTLDDFRARNSPGKKNTFPVDLPTSTPYQLLPQSEKKLLFESEDGWGRLSVMYPAAKVFVSFSDVGFNDDYTQALVYVESFGEGGGGGIYILLDNIDDKWIVRSIYPAWIN
jgi:hypothetical protein